MSRLYNRLVTALYQYEALWLAQWRAGLEAGKVGLKATLLAQHDDGHGGVVIKVNCSPR